MSNCQNIKCWKRQKQCQGCFQFHYMNKKVQSLSLIVAERNMVLTASPFFLILWFRWFGAVWEVNLSSFHHLRPKVFQFSLSEWIKLSISIFPAKLGLIFYPPRESCDWWLSILSIKQYYFTSIRYVNFYKFIHFSQLHYNLLIIFPFYITLILSVLSLSNCLGIHKKENKESGLLFGILPIFGFHFLAD